ncbi:hypothetical protein HON52_01715 [Candidatus Uhrbacteria bacterium]|jgi:hypothetical protein|nr:hypothetical protein [Candidatus Uhrbacteria bacterium]
MKVLKANGKWVEFDESKARTSILRTGVDDAEASSVLKVLKSRMKSGMSTKEVYAIIHQELKKVSVCFSCRYSLRDALQKLGPAGYKFEKYVASILRAHKYDAYVPDQDLEGSCVDHEVDVIAEKDGRKIFIEAKFRNNNRNYVNLKDTMATWSRFLDLVDGAAVGKCVHFDECWIVTNARFSDRARTFGVCKGIHMIGWSFPPERSFQKMVDIVSLYPVTVLDSITQKELEALSHQRLMLCKEVVEVDSVDLAQRLDVSNSRATELIGQCVTVIEGGSKSKKKRTGR